MRLQLLLLSLLPLVTVWLCVAALPVSALSGPAGPLPCPAAEDVYDPYLDDYELAFQPLNQSAYAVSPTVTKEGCSLPPYVCAYQGTEDVHGVNRDVGVFFACPAGFIYSGNSNFRLGIPYVDGADLQSCEPGILPQWLYPVPQCIQPSFSGCHTVTVDNAAVAECAANEIVLSGAPSCDPSTLVSSSEPTTALNGWTAGCRDGSVPTSIVINCCPAATDTFVVTQPYDPSSQPTAADPATQTPLALTSGLLAAGSSFQSCEYASSAPALYAQTNSDTLCPEGKVTVAGGGTCAFGDALVINSPAFLSTGLGDSWASTCLSTRPPVHVAAVCCYWLGSMSSVTATASSGSCSSGSLLLAMPQLCASSSLSLTLSGFSQTVPAASTCSPSQLQLTSTNLAQYTEPSFFCIPSVVQAQISGTGTVGCQPSTLSAIGGTVSFNSRPAASGLYSVETVATLTCYDGWYTYGAISATCRGSGQWDASFSDCYHIDARGCVTVTTAQTGNNTLGCPQDGNDWIMVNAGGGCNAPGQTAGQLLSDYPTSTNTWAGLCNVVGSNSRWGTNSAVPYWASATCCPVASNPIFQICALVAGPVVPGNPAEGTTTVSCPASQFALTGGGACWGVPNSVVAGDAFGLGSCYGGPDIDSSTPYPSYLPTQWTVNCAALTSGELPVFEATFVNVVCCELPTVIAQLTAPLVDISVPATGTSPYAAGCDSGDMMVANGFDCGVYTGTSGSGTNEQSSAAQRMPAAVWPNTNPASFLNGGAYGAQVSQQLSCQFTPTQSGPGKGTAYGTQIIFCLPAGYACNFSGSLYQEQTSTLGLYWPSGDSNTVSCSNGFALPNGLASAAVSCAVQTGETVLAVPGPCSPLSCLTLPTFSDGSWEQTTGVTGDVVALNCNSGYYALTPYIVCQGNSPFNNVPSSSWYSPSYEAGQPLSSSVLTRLCAPGSHESLTYSVQPLDQYSYTVTFQPYPTSYIPSGYTGPVEYNVSYVLQFPDIAQLSSSNALEAGLLSPVTNTSTVFTVSAVQNSSNPDWSAAAGVYNFTVYSDVNRHIEGVKNLLLITPIAVASSNFTSYYAAGPTTVQVQLQCGCDLIHNPNGAIINASLVQELDADNEIVLQFLPQSLCAYDYKITQNVSGVLSDVALPILETYYIENAAQCPYVTQYSTPVAQVTADTAGRPVQYCIQPMPGEICEACTPEYEPGVNSPDITLCLPITPAYWFNVQGQVLTALTSGAVVQSVVPGVTITLTLVDSTGAPLQVQGQQVSASGQTDEFGNFDVQLASTLLTAPSYDVLITPSKVDEYDDAEPTLLCLDEYDLYYDGVLAFQLATVAPGTAVLFSDGSQQQTTTVVTTQLSVTNDLTCNPAVYPHTMRAANASVQRTLLAEVEQQLLLYNSVPGSDPTNPVINLTTSTAGSNTTASLQEALNLTASIVPLCLLANAEYVTTSVTVTITTVTSVATSYVTGVYGGQTVTSNSSSVSAFQTSWQTPLFPNVTLINNLSVNALEKLNAAFSLPAVQLANLTSATVIPYLEDSKGRLVLANVLVGDPSATLSLPLTLTLPPQYPLSASGNAVSANSSLSFTDGQVEVTVGAATEVVQTLSVLSAATAAPGLVTKYTNPELSQYVVTTLQLSNNATLSYSPVQTTTTSALLMEGQETTGSAAQDNAAVLAALSAGNGAFEYAQYNYALEYPLPSTSTALPIVVQLGPATVSGYSAQLSTSFSSTAPAVTLTLLNSTAALTVTPLWTVFLQSLYYSTAEDEYTLPSLAVVQQNTHTFQLQGTFPASSSLTTTVTHAQVFSGVVFNDLSEVPVVGHVYIAALPLLPGIELCGMPGVIITAYAVQDTTFSSPLAVSAATGNDGGYMLSVPTQQVLVLVPTYQDIANVSVTHYFSPSTRQISVKFTPIQGQWFNDTTTNNLTVSLVGGLCQLPVGQVNPVLVADSCGGTHYTLPAYSDLATIYSLPALQAHVLSYTANPRDNSGLQLPSGSSDLLYQATVNAWLVTNGQIVVDLRQSNQQAALVYNSTTTIALLPPYQPQTCVDPTTALPFQLWTQGDNYTITFSLSQQYGPQEFVQQCNNIDPSIGVFVHDEATADTSSQCYSGCVLAATTYDGLTTTTTYTTVAGDPYIFQRSGSVPAAPDYTADIQYGIDQSLVQEQYVLHVLISGAISYGGEGSIPQPPQNPLFILRKPPGGSSYATVSTVNSLSGYTTNSNGFTENMAVNLAVTVAATVDESSCAGLGVEICQNIVNLVSGSQESAGVQQSLQFAATAQSSTLSSITTTASTSNDASLQGGMGDLFLLSTGDLIFSLSTVVSASPPSAAGFFTCSVTQPFDTWTYTQAAGTFFTWYSQDAIVNTIIPELQSLVLDMYVANNYSTVFSNPVNQTNLLELQGTIIDWKNLVALNQQLTANAVPWPELEQGLNLNFSLALNNNGVVAAGLGVKSVAASLAASGLFNGASQVAFAGNEGLFSFSVSGSVSNTYQFSTTFGIGLNWALNYGTDLSVLGADNAFSVQYTGSLIYNFGNTNSSTATYTNTITMYLGDPDAGDLYNIAIMRDTLFGSPAYQIISGQSRCPPEPNTIAREQLTVTMDTAVFNSLDPYNTTTTTLRINNISPTQETWQYFLNLQTETNTGALIITANGLALGYNQVLLTVPYGSTAVSISFSRGTGSGYEFNNVTFSVTTATVDSACEDPYVVTVAFDATYTEPCNLVSWAGALLYSSSFVVNGYDTADFGVDGSYFPFEIYNPEAQVAGREWQESYAAGTLLNITAQYLPAGGNSAEWEDMTALSLTGTTVPIDPISGAAAGDYFAWYGNMQSLSGHYSFRVITQCQVPTNLPPNADLSLYSSSSSIVTGVIDRKPPVEFGVPLPAIGPTGVAVYYPGDAISITFDSAIVCSSIYGRLQVVAYLCPNGTQAGLAEQNKLKFLSMQWQCSGATIALNFLYPNWAQLSGQWVVVSVAGFTDEAGNPPSDPAPIAWAFQVANFDVGHTTVSINGFVVSGAATDVSTAVTRASSSLPVVNTTGSARRLLQQEPAFSVSSVQTLLSALTVLDNANYGVVNISAVPIAQLLSQQLVYEAIAAVDLQLLYAQQPISQLAPAQISVQSVSYPSIVASFTFLPAAGAYTVPASLRSFPSAALTPSAAAAAFAAALLNTALLPYLSSASLFPLLSSSAMVQLLQTGASTATVSSNSNYPLTLSLQQVVAVTTPSPGAGADPSSISSGSANSTATTTNVSLALPSPVITNSTSALLNTANSIISASLSSVVEPASLASGSPLASLSLTFNLSSAFGSNYRNLTAVSISYTPLPDPEENPDVVAETSYPTTTLAPGSAVVSLYNEQHGSYYLFITAVPTQPGGLQYSLTLTDELHAGGPLVFYSQTAFVTGPPQTPQLLSVTQVSTGSLQLQFLPSVDNGLSFHSGDENQYYTLTLQPLDDTGAANGSAVTVPVMAMTRTNVTAAVSNPALVYYGAAVTCGDEGPMPAPVLVNVLLSAVTGLTLPEPGSSLSFTVSASCSNLLTASSQSQLNFSILSAPAAVPLLAVVPTALNKFSLTFASPASAGLPVVAWIVGTTPSLPPATNSTVVTVDSVASASVLQLISGVDTTQLTTVFPTSTPAVFSFSVQAVSVLGPSPLHLHVFTPAYASPPSALSVTQHLTGSGGLQSAVVNFQPPATILPSSSLLLGYQLLVSPNPAGLLLPVVLPVGASSVTVSGLSVPSSPYLFQLYAVINSTANAAKLSMPGAVLPLLSAPASQTLTLVQPPGVPTILNFTQLNATAAQVFFTPGDGSKPYTGQATLLSYQAGYVLLSSSSQQVVSNAEWNSNSSTVIPRQVLSPPPYSSSSSLLTDSIIMTGLPQAGAGQVKLLSVGVSAKNSSGFQAPALLQPTLGLLGPPLPPALSFTQTAGNLTVASFQLSVTASGVLSPAYRVQYQYQQLTGLVGTGPVVSAVIPLSSFLPSASAYVALTVVEVAAGIEAYNLTAQAVNEAGGSTSAWQLVALEHGVQAPSPLLATVDAATNSVELAFTEVKGATSYNISWSATSASVAAAALSSTQPSLPSLVNVVAEYGLVNGLIPMPELPGWLPGYATSYEFSVTSVSAFPNTAPASSVTVQAPVSNPCCLTFQPVAYPSFTVSLSQRGPLPLATALYTSAGQALPWLPPSWTQVQCVDEGLNAGRLSFFNWSSSSFQSAASNAFQLTSGNQLLFAGWDLPDPTVLDGQVLRMPLTCSASSAPATAASISTCVQFTVNAPSQAQPSLSYSAAQADYCSGLFSYLAISA